MIQEVSLLGSRNKEGECVMQMSEITRDVGGLEAIKIQTKKESRRGNNCQTD